MVDNDLDFRSVGYAISAIFEIILNYGMLFLATKSPWHKANSMASKMLLLLWFADGAIIQAVFAAFPCLMDHYNSLLITIGIYSVTSLAVELFTVESMA